MSKKKQSVYSAIAEDIVSKIKSGVYPKGSLLPPEREFMTIYSVERTTVRRGLDLIKHDGYIKKIAGLGSMVMSDVPVRILSDEAGNVSSSAHFANTIPSDRVRGAVVIPYKSPDALPSFARDLLACLSENAPDVFSDISDIKENTSIISIGEDVESNREICLCLCQSDDRRSVVTDNDKAAYVALSYLEELGHEKIAYIGTDKGLAFENGLFDSFATVNSFYKEELVSLSGSDEKAGFDGFSELFRRHGGKFTAVCTCNDETALGVIKAAKYYKLNIPDDISVISLCSSRKTSGIDGIYYDTNEFAEEVFHSMAHPKRIATVLFGGNLLVHGTTGKTSSADGGKKMSDFLL